MSDGGPDASRARGDEPMSTQQGMITDADGDIAALVYGTGDRPDLVLLDFAPA